MISPTTDIDFIYRCVTSPNNWRAAMDDGAPDPALFFVALKPDELWLRSDDDGVFLLTTHNSIMLEVHTILLPSAYGRAEEIAKQLLDWVFSNTKAERIITTVPRFNSLALRLSRKVGFKEFGVNPASFKKGGIKHDQIMLGIDRE